MEKDNRIYPSALISRRFMPTNDKVFTLLYWCGMSLQDAYRYAYETSGNNHSLTTMASRKKQEEHIQTFLDTLQDSKHFLKFKY